MLISGATTNYEVAPVTGLYESVLARDFDLLRRVGMRNLVAYGEAVRDSDNDSPARMFSYYGQMPQASSTLTALSLTVHGLLRELKQPTLLNLKAVQVDHAVRFAFNHDGRKIDIVLLNNTPPGAETAARAAPIGLCGIAVNDRGFCFASAAYLDDKYLKTLTINSDMQEPDRHHARRQAGDLIARPAYKNFKIVG